jgi:2,4-dienoyl-CoA reductase-like NADH-dependent reductase (Old Yellow Enzyme family)
MNYSQLFQPMALGPI